MCDGRDTHGFLNSSLAKGMKLFVEVFFLFHEKLYFLTRLEDTLYLEVMATSVKPSLVVVFDDGWTSIGFGDVGLGT